MQAPCPPGSEQGADHGDEEIGQGGKYRGQQHGMSHPSSRRSLWVLMRAHGPPSPFLSKRLNTKIWHCSPHWLTRWGGPGGLPSSPADPGSGAHHGVRRAAGVLGPRRVEKSVVSLVPRSLAAPAPSGMMRCQWPEWSVVFAGRGRVRRPGAGEPAAGGAVPDRGAARRRRHGPGVPRALARRPYRSRSRWCAPSWPGTWSSGALPPRGHGGRRRQRGVHRAGVVDADPDGPQPWLATVYVSGPSLSEAVAAHGPLAGPAVLALGAGLAEALEAIHAAGVVHRDLKPSNVLLAADGPRVIDFGISTASEASALTHTGRPSAPPASCPLNSSPAGPSGGQRCLRPRRGAGLHRRRHRPVRHRHPPRPAFPRRVRAARPRRPAAGAARDRGGLPGQGARPWPTCSTG